MLNLSQMELAIEEAMKTAQVPGLALSILHHREIFYLKGFGIASVENSALPVTPQTLFRIASLTKPIVGTLIMRLVEQGIVALDASIKTYLPWLIIGNDEPSTRLITLRTLLSHTSGLPDTFSLYDERHEHALALFMREQLPAYQLFAPPGKVWWYSSLGIALAGYIAEVVTGLPFAQLLHSLVLEPLQMLQTTFDPTLASMYPHALPHQLDKDGQLRAVHRVLDNFALRPAGFLYSNALDLTNFVQMHLHRGNFYDQVILSPQSVTEMHRPQVNCYTTADSAYCLTFSQETYKGLRQVRHDGGFGTFGSRLVMLPEQGSAVILLHNHLSPAFNPDKLINRILDDLFDLPTGEPVPQATAPDTSLWARYMGNYVCQYHGIVSVKRTSGQLVLQTQHQELPLQAYNQHTYFALQAENQQATTVGFIPEAAGPTQYIALCGLYGSVGTRLADNYLYTPDLQTLQDYAGSYYLEGLTTLTFRVKDGQLLLYEPLSNQETPCIPLNAYTFAGTISPIEFFRDANGSVSHIRIARGTILHRVC
jgi:CubicO group peptidase (beta-lactamase class C family)